MTHRIVASAFVFACVLLLWPKGVPVGVSAIVAAALAGLLYFSWVTKE